MAKGRPQNKGISTFEKGINKDSSKVAQPKGTYRHANNVVQMSDDGDLFSLTNERGAQFLDASLPNFYTVIGKSVLDQDILLILINTSQTNIKVGYIDSTNNYVNIATMANEPVYTDANPDEYSFSINNPVQCISRRLITGDRVIYYTDNNQPFGYFNIDEIIESGVPLPGVSKLIPDNKLINTEFVDIVDGTGILKCGSYQIIPRYVTKDGTHINYSIPTNIIPITNEGKGVAWNRYDGGGFNEQTSKAIRLKFTNVDSQFSYIEVIAIRYEGNTSTLRAYQVAQLPIKSGSDINYVFGSIPEDAIPLSDEELALVPISYDRAKTIVQKDNRLFLGNLKETKVEFQQELQEIANRITVGYSLENIPHKQTVDGEFLDYKNEKTIHDKRTYRRGEVYSFGLVVIYKDGTESYSYHIPGNNKTDPGSAIESTYIPANFPNMGTYISTVDYPQSTSPDDIEYPGNTAGYDTGVGATSTRIRHHYMPTLSQHVHFQNDGVNGLGGEESISLIGVTFEFGQAFSEDLLDIIQDVRIYRERRDTPEKRSMLAQGICSPIAKTFDNYRDKSYSPKNDDYKGAAVEGFEIYKKAPAFGSVIIDNNCYLDDNPGSNYNSSLGNGMVFSPIESGTPIYIPIGSSYIIVNASSFNGGLYTELSILGSPFLISSTIEISGSTNPVYNGYHKVISSLGTSLVINFPYAGGTTGSIRDVISITNKYENSTYVKQMCFHSPETQLSNGAFLSEAEAASAYVRSELEIKGPSSIKFKPSEFVQNVLNTRTGYNNFNSMEWYADFQGWEAITQEERKIQYAQKITHGEQTKLRSDSDEVENYNFDNTFSTGFLYIDTYNQASPGDNFQIAEDREITIELNEGRENKGLNPDKGIPSRVLGISSGGEYKVRLINIFKKGILNQYGQIEDSEYIDCGSVFDTIDLNQLATPGFQSEVIYGGDTYITKFGITNKQVWRRVMPFENGPTSTFYNGDTQVAGTTDLSSGATATQEDFFFRTKSAIDDAIYRGGDEFHTLAYFFVESNINTEYRHEIKNEDNSTPLPYYPKRGIDEVLTDPPENNDSEGYNVQYSFENVTRPTFSASTRREVIRDFPNRMIYSDIAEADDIADSYRTFSQFNKYDIPKETGDIWNMFVYNNNLYTHTPKSLWMNFVNALTQQTNDLGTVLLGTGGLFSTPSRQMFTSEGGFCGCISQFGTIVTPYGVFFPDVLQGKQFLLTTGVEEISSKGMSQFFDNNLGTGLIDGYVDNPYNQASAGITGGWDHELKRVILSKRGVDGSEFTFSYSPFSKCWVSEHDYLPNIMVERNNELFAFWDDGNGSNLFHHNRGDYGVFYDGVYPVRLHLAMNSIPSHEKSFDNINIHSIAYSDNNTFEAFRTLQTIRCYDDYQDSGIVNINATNDFNPALANDEILGRWKKNHFQVALPRDKQTELEEITDQWTRATRMKSKVLDVEFTYENQTFDNTKLTINFIEYFFRITAR